KEPFARAGTADAQAVQGPEQGAVRSAQKEIALPGEIAIRRKGEWQSRMGGAVDPALDATALSHDEPHEQRLSRTERETLGPRIGEIVQGAKTGSGRRLSGVQLGVPTLWRQ